jgi:hypothetical protein
MIGITMLPQQARRMQRYAFVSTKNNKHAQNPGVGRDGGRLGEIHIPFLSRLNIREFCIHPILTVCSLRETCEMKFQVNIRLSAQEPCRSRKIRTQAAEQWLFDEHTRWLCSVKYIEHEEVFHPNDQISPTPFRNSNKHRRHPNEILDPSMRLRCSKNRVCRYSSTCRIGISRLQARGSNHRHLYLVTQAKAGGSVFSSISPLVPDLGGSVA